MPKLALIAVCHVDNAGQRDRLVPVLVAHGERSKKEEPGRALAFDVLVPEDDETKVYVYELFESLASWEKHHDGQSVRCLREEAAAIGYITQERITATKYAVAD